MFTKSIKTLLLFIFIFLLGTGCSSTEANNADETKIVEITMQEFAFDPSSIEVSANQIVEFHITNNGVLAHDFEISTADAITAHIEGGHADHNDDAEMADADDADVNSVKITLQPGETGVLTFTFDRDEELFFVCLIPGHYEAGMVGQIEMDR